ncbi:hypothetical protein ABT332_13665 [Saccharomonospora azurea]|uniref:hypothetical protein n=1 Tax=Saccharomonospora azurea TaxID=40988 RepID=UPI003328DF4B
MNRPDWANLKKHIEARMRELGIQGWREFELASGLKPTHRQRLLNKQDYKTLGADKAAGIERALAWEPGSVESCIAGGEPILASDATEMLAPPNPDRQRRGGTATRRSTTTQPLPDTPVERASPSTPDVATSGLHMEIFARWAHKVGTVFTRADLGELVQDLIAMSSTAKQNRPSGVTQEGRDDPPMG